MTGSRVAADRAAQAWQALIAACRTSSPRGVRIHEPGAFRVVFAWPLSQVLHSAVLLRWAGVLAAPLSAEDVWRSFKRYRQGNAFADAPIGGRRYYDDNAWIGLACALHVVACDGGVSVGAAGPWLARAQSCLRFVEEGRDPGGGVRWVEHRPGVHACSTGSAGLLSATLARAGADEDRSFAASCLAFLDARLTRDDGLIADALTGSGQVVPDVFTYNQALAIQLRLECGDIAGAEDLADAVIRAFGPQRLFEHPAVFNAILCRALLRLDAVTGDARWASYVEEYVERCWIGGRDSHGLLTRVGRYDRRGVVIDHAALVGVLAALALPRSDRLLLV